MGKVRKLRQKYHLSKVGDAKSAKVTAQTGVEAQGEPPSRGIPFTSCENIFAGLDITYDTLTKSLPQDFDARSVVSTKSRKDLKLEEQHLKKKMKMKLRRERFLQKLDVTQQAIKAALVKKKQKKKQIIGDLNPLLDALPTLESLACDKIKKEAKATNKSKGKPKGIMKMKKRVKQQTSDTKLMKKILKDKKFKSSPGQTIIEFLKQKVASGR